MSSIPSPPTGPPPAATPGKIRTWWQPLLDPSKLHLLVLALRLTRPYREELRVLGVTAQQEQPGVWRLQGGLVVHPTWVLETEELAGPSHPLLTLFSPQFLANGVAT